MTRMNGLKDTHQLSCSIIHGSTVSLLQYRQQHNQQTLFRGKPWPRICVISLLPGSLASFARVSGPLLHRQHKLTLDDFQLASTQPSQTSLVALQPTSRHFWASALTWPLQSKRKKTEQTLSTYGAPHLPVIHIGLPARRAGS